MPDRAERPPPWEPADPDQGKHEVAGIHGHAYYPSPEDLQARLDAAVGGPTPSQYSQQLPAPDPAQQ
jgi:hypothetical protein